MPVNLGDKRVQRVLRAVQSHPDCSQSELWFLELNRWHDNWEGGKRPFNPSWVSTLVRRLIKEGFLARGKHHRLSLTPEGDAAIRPLIG